MERFRSIFGTEEKPIRGGLRSKGQLQTALQKCKYQHPSEVERDIIEATSTFSDLLPSSDVYVSNDGFELNLICLGGTIPVNYKGNMYFIPICIWLSHQHPDLPPLVQVKPTSKMTIKIGKNVDDAGMVSIPYLDEWNKSTSDLVGLIQVLCVVFGENTPLYSSSPNNTPSYAKEIPESCAASKQVQKPSKEHSLVKPVVIEKPNVGDTRSKRAKLLLDVDAILTSAQIIKGQTVELITILESSKSELIKSPVSEDRLTRLSGEKKIAEEWLSKLKQDLSDTNTKSNQFMNAVYDEGENKANITSVVSPSYQNWSNDDVCGWFESIGMGEFVASVREHGIRGVHLPNLAKDDLIELGIVKLGQRMTIDDEINKLCNRAMNIV